ncbi:MAG: DUF11 domain-containing protein, partial [Propionibacteriaceae bacterium]
MRRSSSLSRPRRMLNVLATAVVMALLACGVAVADTVTTNFEPNSSPPFFIPGSVDGQDGWTSAVPGDIPGLPLGYDQRVVSNSGAPPAFGGQSLRHSNAFNEPTGEFFFQTYSKRTSVPAGEGLTNTEYIAEFSFISTNPDELQPGLNMRISPDSGVGGRMSFIGLQDTAGGIALNFYDTDADGEFVAHSLGTVSRDAVHRIKFWIKLNPGPNNDLVRMYIDGVDVGQCFTTWESFYPRVPEPVPAINSLQFRASGGDIPGLAGGGYLFDNVTVTTANGPGPRDCSGGDEGPPDDIVIDKTALTRVARPGELITYRITVRNRGDAPVRGLRACDRAPRALRFLRASLRLYRAGDGRLCLMIHLLRPGQRIMFHATFRLRANVTADTVTNGSSADTQTVSAPSPSPPDGAGNKPRRRRHDSDAARVRVRTAPEVCPAALK